jgi:hypothetical protein
MTGFENRSEVAEGLSSTRLTKSAGEPEKSGAYGTGSGV